MVAADRLIMLNQKKNINFASFLAENAYRNAFGIGWKSQAVLAAVTPLDANLRALATGNVFWEDHSGESGGEVGIRCQERIAFLIICEFLAVCSSASIGFRKNRM